MRPAAAKRHPIPNESIRREHVREHMSMRPSDVRGLSATKNHKQKANMKTWNRFRTLRCTCKMVALFALDLLELYYARAIRRINAPIPMVGGNQKSAIEYKS